MRCALIRRDINLLNVYPVPDGDTGTNMALTLEAVVSRARRRAGRFRAGRRVPGHRARLAHGGTRQLRRDPLPTPPGHVRAHGRGRRGAASTAPCWPMRWPTPSDLARRAVVRPVEGTILTVASAAAEGAAAGVGRGGATLVGVVEEAHRTAADALARTPEMLPVLAQAGVVDAGGTGFLLLLDACWSIIDEAHLLPEPSGVPAVDLSRLGGAETSWAGGGLAGERGESDEEGAHDVGDLRYEVMYLLYAPDDSMADFKEVWAGIGDSIVVVGGDGLWNCHIHTDDIGAAIEAGVDAGRPQRIRVTDLAEQVEEERWVREAAERAGGGAERAAGRAGADRRAWSPSSRVRGSAASSARWACTIRWSGGNQ